MSPLLLVNWHRVAVRFRGLMWLLALALAIVIVIHAAPRSTARAHLQRTAGSHPVFVRNRP